MVGDRIFTVFQKAANWQSNSDVIETGAHVRICAGAVRESRPYRDPLTNLRPGEWLVCQSEQL